MRGDKELTTSSGVRKQLRDGLEEVWVKAGLGFVQREQCRRARTQRNREQAKLPERPIGKLPRIEGTRDSRHLHEQAEPALGRLHVNGRTRKCEIHAAL